MVNNTSYSEKVKDHFLNPRNMGKLENADGVGQMGNFLCGDVMQVYIQVEKDKEGVEYIKDIKFQTMGCAAAISTSSMITELAKGKTLEKAMKITNASVAKELDGLPPIKMHCSNLAADTLHMAIKDYYKKQGFDISELEKKDACYRCCEH
ncbi:iron-sulfur cluster assembly scaffold protein [archaeon]|nr:iron-sulfur cluster assembly scaffold protein [archaeon]